MEVLILGYDAVEGRLGFERIVKLFLHPTEADQYVQKHYPKLRLGEHDRETVNRQSRYIFKDGVKGSVGVIFRFPNW